MPEALFLRDASRVMKKGHLIYEEYTFNICKGIKRNVRLPPRYLRLLLRQWIFHISRVKFVGRLPQNRFIARRCALSVRVAPRAQDGR